MTVFEARRRWSPGPTISPSRGRPRAFNFGLEHGGWRDYEFVGKLDGDVELPRDWFATLIERFEAERTPRSRAAGLPSRPRGGWTLHPDPPAIHVHGAVKLFRRRVPGGDRWCPERLGWDTIDETYARMRGFEAYSYADLVGRHHRPWGSPTVASGVGRAMGSARGSSTTTCSGLLLRSLKVARVPPLGLSGRRLSLRLRRAAMKGVPRVEDRAFRLFVRGELRRRMLHPGALQRRPPGLDGLVAPIAGSAEKA